MALFADLGDGRGILSVLGYLFCLEKIFCFWWRRYFGEDILWKFGGRKKKGKKKEKGKENEKRKIFSWKKKWK